MKALPVLVAIFILGNLIPSNAGTVSTNNADGTKTVSIVDGQKRPLEISEYNADGSLVKKTAFERDQEGKPLKMTVRSADGHVKRVEIYSYDQNGNVVATKTTNQDGAVWTRQDAYDEHGNHLKSRVIDPKGNEGAPDVWLRAD
jgi:hypothetical protein